MIFASIFLFKRFYKKSLCQRLLMSKKVTKCHSMLTFSVSNPFLHPPFKFRMLLYQFLLNNHIPEPICSQGWRLELFLLGCEDVESRSGFVYRLKLSRLLALDMFLAVRSNFKHTLTMVFISTFLE